MSTSQRFFRAFGPGSGDEQLPRGERETRPTFSVRGHHQVLRRLDRGDFSVGRGPKIHAAVREREPKLLSTPWGMAISDGNVGTVSILRTGSQAETSSQRTTRGARSETPLPNLNGHPGTEQGGGSRLWHQCDQEFQSLCAQSHAKTSPSSIFAPCSSAHLSSQLTLTTPTALPARPRPSPSLPPARLES